MPSNCECVLASRLKHRAVLSLDDDLFLRCADFERAFARSGKTCQSPRPLAQPVKKVIQALAAQDQQLRCKRCEPTDRTAKMECGRSCSDGTTVNLTLPECDNCAGGASIRSGW